MKTNRLGNPEQLRDLATFVSGGTPSRQQPAYWTGATPWVSAKDLKAFRVEGSIDTLSDEGRKIANLVPAGTALILVRGMALFKSIPIGITTRELAINQDVKGLIPREGVSGEFLAYSLMAREQLLMQMVEPAGHGTGRLHTETLKDIVLPVPPLAEQHKIVALLSTWDSAISKSEQQLTALRKQQRGLMQKLVSGEWRFRQSDREAAE
jgi:type I restriction enzyme S subunit